MLVDAELDLAALDLGARPWPRPSSRCRSSGSASGRAGRAPCPGGRPCPSGPASRRRRRSRASPLRPRSISSSAPTMSAPAAAACCGRGRRWRRPATRAVLPVPCGRLTVPRTIWSALRGSTPEAEGDLDGGVVLRGRGLLRQPDGLERGVERVAVDLLGGGAVGLAALHVVLLGAVVGRSRGRRAGARPCHCWCGRCASAGCSALDGDAHRPGGAGDDLRRRRRGRWR